MLHQPHMDWIEARGIDVELASRFGLSTTSDGGKHWLSVPYIERGQTINHKHRMTSAKRHRMDEGAPLTLWNHDTLVDCDPNVPLVITEGEWDALTAIHCGKWHAVSVPNGAPGENEESVPDPTPENDRTRYAYLWRSRELLDRVQTIVLATDADGPGRKLCQELARRLGPERCKFVVYPDDCKDLNDVLLKHGAATVTRVIDGAKPYPIKGLYRIDDFPEPPEMEARSLGLPYLDEFWRLVPGTFSVVTGYPGHGKTSFILWLIAHQLRVGVNVALGSFETLVKPILQRRLRACLIGCGEYALPAASLPEADRILAERLTIIAHNIDEPDEEMTLEELIENARIAVIRDGVKLLVIDPWNEIEHKRRSDESETDYTGRAIRALKAFAKAYECAVWLVAHPRKPMVDGVKPKPPGLYDIAGSANFANKADYGISVHRPNPDKNVSEILIRKVRMGLPGKMGTVEAEWRARESKYIAYPPETAESAAA